MTDTVNAIIVLAAVVCTLCLLGRIIYQILRNKYAQVKSVKAQVVDKYKADKFTKIYGSFARAPQYYVVFRIDKKKKTFRISEFSYGGYRVGECGTLVYKSDKLVDFK